jgi:tetratricopeptide (TPR) repeat protein
MLAHEQAAEHYARALDVLERFRPDATPTRGELLLALGEARIRAGERQAGWEALREAALLAAELGDGAGVARAAIGASQRYVQQPGVVDEELIEMLERALEMTTGERTLRRVQLLARLCGALYYAPGRSRMQELSDEAMEIAGALGDPEALAYASAAQRRALWDPAHLKQRLEASTAMLTHASEARNAELELQAHAWLVVDLLEYGDREAVDAQIDSFNAGADRLRQPLYLWNAIVWRAMRALLAGSLEEAEELATQALTAGATAEAVTAPQYYAIQLLVIRREQLRFAELEQAARQLVESNPARPAWRAALSALLFESGQLDAAREQFDLLAAADFSDIPHDGDWMIAMTLLSDVCVGLRDAARAELLYEQLLPHKSAGVVIGLAAACLGSTARFLGKLAWTMDRPRDATEHFDEALSFNARLNAPVCLAHSQLDYALVLGRRGGAGGLVEAAARTAQELKLPWVAQRATKLGAH